MEEWESGRMGGLAPTLPPLSHSPTLPLSHSISLLNHAERNSQRARSERAAGWPALAGPLPSGGPVPAGLPLPGDALVVLVRCPGLAAAGRESAGPGQPLAEG